MPVLGLKVKGECPVEIDNTFEYGHYSNTKMNPEGIAKDRKFARRG